MSFTLKNIVPWGRSFDEYVSMFDLTSDDLQKRILGCGDGPASFNSAMNKRGQPIISVDPIYKFSANEIKDRISETYKEVITQLEISRNDYVWDTFKTPEELGTTRMESMQEFLSDFTAGKTQGRYITAELPDLPFEDKQFDLVLCSHLLFLYSEQLSLKFHEQAILELCRVGKEVRLFPLVTLSGLKSPYFEDIKIYLKKNGYTTKIKTVPYEFRRGGNEMMVITE